MSTREDPKRLAPRSDTTRELFARSGNQCAFNPCNRVIIDADGNYVGEICHIRGAKPGSARYDPNMSNEQRRAFKNLILLCHDHHVATHDADKYPVSRMEEMKNAHESKYSGALDKIHADIVDEMDVSQPQPATSLQRYDTELDHGMDHVELTELVEDAKSILESLQKVPERTRQFFAKAIRRSTKARWGNSDREVAAHELRNALEITDDEIREHTATLDKYGFAEGEHTDEDGSVMLIYALGEGPWEFWSEMIDFCKLTDHTLEELVVDLNFSILD